MSSSKRRVKRKIAMIVKMDVTHHLCQFRWARTNSEREATAHRVFVAMRALGVSMAGNVQQRAIVAINEKRESMNRVEMS